MNHAEWRVDVTDADVLAARDAWWDARERGASPERVEVLWDGLGWLLRAQVQQLLADHLNGRELT